MWRPQPSEELIQTALAGLVNPPQRFLSHGLGVDTNALSVLLHEDVDPRFHKYRPDRVLHIDTGSELPHTTLVSLPAMRDFHAGHGQEIEVISCDDPRYQMPSKVGPLDLTYRRQRKPGIPTRSLRSCTACHKVAPFRARVNELDDRRYGRWRKAGGRHTVIVGIAADEAHRCGGLTSYVDPSAQYLRIVYPLVEHGWTRRMCVELLRERGLPALKSGCFCCPFQPVSWYSALRRAYPELHARSVAMENDARAHNPKLLLTSDVPLDDAIDAWEARQLAVHGRLPDPYEILAGTYERGDRAWACSTP